MKVSVVAIIYNEPEWTHTKECIEDIRDKVQEIVYVDRGGVGSLAKAYNDGFRHLSEPTDIVWFISNVTFNPDALDKLVKEMDKYDGIHPAFDSDHKHIRPNGTDTVADAPFLEFTAPIVRYELFDKIQLDESMPYWGHDLDWSYRAKSIQARLGVHHGVVLGHTYIRNSKPHAVTLQRKRLRRLADSGTRSRLVELYGDKWRGVLFPGQGNSVTKFYENVIENILK